LRIVSPGSGGASGCRQYTGKRIEIACGWPFFFAGTKCSSRAPTIAALSSAGVPLASATVV